MAGTRKIAAILVADIVGYSRLAGADEDRTLSRLRGLRSDLIDPAIDAHRGRIVKRTGDGSIIEFRSVVDAVRCAIEVQNGLVERNAGLPPERRIEFRVGVHLGDVVEEEDGDLMGDGVNIAARLEGIAEPGGICLSNAAHEQVRDKLKEGFVDLGEKVLKNIARPVRVYQLIEPSMPAAKEYTQTKPALALPDKPSIAVLPFQNMSGDPEQEYFADGVVEDITTALSRFHWLFVIARNSSFTFRNRAVEAKQVGLELGVSYLLEGSVRKAGNRVRITGQLIDASTGVHLWADRFEGESADIFALQDRVTASIVGAIAPKLEQVEIERAKHKPTKNLDAYDHYLRALGFFYQMDRAANDNALQFFGAAIERDPNFAIAYAKAAQCYSLRKANGWMVDRTRECAEAARLARRAVDVGRDDAVALCYGGLALSYVVGDLQDGAAFVERALALNVNLAPAWSGGGWTKLCLGEPEIAIERVGRAIRLSPLDPNMYLWQSVAALAHFCVGRYGDAAELAESALRDRPNYAFAMRVAAASQGQAGRTDEARRTLARLNRLDPQLRLSNIDDVMSPLQPKDRERYVEGLRKAGMPER